MAEGGSAAVNLMYDPMQVEESGDVHEDETENAETSQRGRKRVKNPDSWKKKHVKRKGLRQNAPLMTIDDTVGKDCCKKLCIQQISAEHLVSLRQRFAILT